jgi:aryl-alcohol dehydrogenase-like predicted oxidoreductase
MSTFAFGTQRITQENLLHIEALKEAIEMGVRIIDTAPYYTNGSSQRAVAQVMGLFEDEIRSEIEIISKYRFANDESLENDLTQTLQNLQLNSIETFLIDTPESFIYESIEKKMAKDEMLDALYEKLFKAFVSLEKEVQNGRIKGYGISSDAFAKEHSAADFLPYEDLLTLAQKAAKELGKEQHSFTTVAFVLNLLERDGLLCAAWAKRNGVRVLTNRALNAQKDGLMYRLAEYEEPKEYYHTLNELLEICDNKELEALYNLIEQMDMNRHKFAFVEEYDTFLVAQILPHIKKTIEKIPTELLDTLLEYIERFLTAYRDVVAYEAAKMTKVALKEYFQECNKKMQECALEYLLKIDDIDAIVVGMRKPTYVEEIMALKS